MQPVLILKLLILIAVANGTPVLAKKLFGEFLAQPLDGGATFFDGRPIFGPSKTIRGLVLSVLATLLFAMLLGFTWQLGFVVAVAVMAGDGTCPEQQGHRSRSGSGSAVPVPRQPLAPACDFSRCRYWRRDLLGAGADPIAPLLPFEPARPAVLKDRRYSDRDSRCRVISGGQLKRTGTMQTPAPTEV
jgi:hypothetical protein